jgi:hypothetical protein
VPRFQLRNSAQSMNSTISIRPGMMPAMNSRPIDVSDAMP